MKFGVAHGNSRIHAVANSRITVGDPEFLRRPRYNIHMAEKLIGSLIYGEHATPKKMRPWKERLKVPMAIGIVLFVIGGLAYKFVNYREERRVSEFMAAIENGQYDAAYGSWDTEGHYTMKDFLQDWGKDGYYTKGMHESRVVDSNSNGTSVVVYVALDNFKQPVAIQVDKGTLKLSYSPRNKFRR